MSRSEDDTDPGGSDRTGTPTADGGQALDADIFTRRSEIEAPSRFDRLRRRFDRSIRAPLAIGWEDIRTRVGGILIVFFLLIWVLAVLSTTPAWNSLVQPLVAFSVSIPGFGGVHPLNFLTVPYPYSYSGGLLKPPLSSNYPLGTDNLGRPLGAQIVYATPFMWKMVIAGGVFSVFVGMAVGAIAGYTGGIVDRVLMTLNDAVLTIPALPLVIIFAGLYPNLLQSPYAVGLVLGINNWPGLSRSVRSEVLSLREESFTEASRVMGLSKSYIIRKDLLANLMPMISISFSSHAKGIIFESVGLYFLGILPSAKPNWGVIMNDAYKSARFPDTTMLHWLYVPMFVIILFSLGFLLFAQGLDQVFNVRLRAQHAKTAADDPEAERTG